MPRQDDGPLAGLLPLLLLLLLLLPLLLLLLLGLEYFLIPFILLFYPR